MVLDILYKVRRELQIEEEIEIVPENNLDREVIIKLIQRISLKKIIHNCE